VKKHHIFYRLSLGTLQTNVVDREFSASSLPKPDLTDDSGPVPFPPQIRRESFLCVLQEIILLFPKADRSGRAV
jgi:hypothetical protein